MTSHLYNQVKAEILQDHERNDYKQAYRMPLRDRYNVTQEKHRALKQVAKQLTDDTDFPYEVYCTLHNDHYYTNTVKMSYRPIIKE